MPVPPRLPLRESCRGLLLDVDDRVLLAEHTIGGGTVWVAPGGGVEPDETLPEALARELLEETGLVLGDVEPVEVWTQTAEYPESAALGFSGVRNHYFWLRVTAFDPTPGVAPGADGHPAEEGIVTMRWWTREEIDSAVPGVQFSPRALARLLQEALDAEAAGGLPPAPVPIGR